MLYSILYSVIVYRTNSLLSHFFPMVEMGLNIGGALCWVCEAVFFLIGSAVSFRALRVIAYAFPAGDFSS